MNLSADAGCAIVSGTAGSGDSQIKSAASRRARRRKLGLHWLVDGISATASSQDQGTLRQIEI